MMNGQEKSDFGVVAEKPANKGGEPSAERVEPRPETKGNVGQQRTHRAQDRARVTQALDRVRKAARLKKKERFTALLHHITVDTSPNGATRRSILATDESQRHAKRAGTTPCNACTILRPNWPPSNARPCGRSPPSRSSRFSSWQMTSLAYGQPPPRPLEIVSAFCASSAS